jgi:peptidoglycan/LPS O-acetylase OafA/YrhL
MSGSSGRRPASGVPKARFHIPSLDGLRALSFGIVFAAHAGLGSVVPGGFGVTVFFFLSGFLITTLMRMEWESTGTVSLRKFYIRRALRILPPFYLVLGTATVLTLLGILPGQLQARAVLAQACHYANFWMIHHGGGGFPAGTGVYWSLAVEEHFYVVFPLFYLVLRRLQSSPLQQVSVLLSLCLAALVWRCILVLVFHTPDDRTFLATDTRFDSILFGSALAVYGNPVLDATRKSEAVWKYVLLPLGALGLVASFLIRDSQFRETGRYSLQGIALIPLFVCALRYPTWGFMRALNSRPLSFLGVLSYSLYLIHQVVLVPVTIWLHGALGAGRTALVAVVTLVVTLALAWLVQRVVEKPCARLRRRFSA